MFRIHWHLCFPFMFHRFYRLGLFFWDHLKTPVYGASKDLVAMIVTVDIEIQETPENFTRDFKLFQLPFILLIVYITLYSISCFHYPIIVSYAMTSLKATLENCRNNFFCPTQAKLYLYSLYVRQMLSVLQCTANRLMTFIDITFCRRIFAIFTTLAWFAIPCFSAFSVHLNAHYHPLKFIGKVHLLPVYDTVLIFHRL